MYVCFFAPIYIYIWCWYPMFSFDIWNIKCPKNRPRFKLCFSPSVEREKGPIWAARTERFGQIVTTCRVLHFCYLSDNLCFSKEKFEGEENVKENVFPCVFRSVKHGVFVGYDQVLDSRNHHIQAYLKMVLACFRKKWNKFSPDPWNMTTLSMCHLFGQVWSFPATCTNSAPGRRSVGVLPPDFAVAQGELFQGPWGHNCRDSGCFQGWNPKTSKTNMQKYQECREHEHVIVLERRKETLDWAKSWIQRILYNEEKYGLVMFGTHMDTLFAWKFQDFETRTFPSWWHCNSNVFNLTSRCCRRNCGLNLVAFPDVSSGLDANNLDFNDPCGRPTWNCIELFNWHSLIHHLIEQNREALRWIIATTWQRLYGENHDKQLGSIVFSCLQFWNIHISRPSSSDSNVSAFWVCPRLVTAGSLIASAGCASMAPFLWNYWKL